MVGLSGEHNMALVKKIMPKSVIDNVNDVEPVMDYSFCRFSVVSDCLDEEPRNQKDAITPRGSKETETEEEHRLSKSRCFFLNNNGITELTDLRSTMEGIFSNVDNVGWLNLSFNEIATLEPLTQLPHLEILYLHGNSISDIAEVERLSVLHKLKKATFHGNPIENIKGYRQYVLASLSHLKVLDFSNVTREDRTRIHAWKMVSKSKQKKKRKNNDDD